ncbi:tetratricopeptide repeat protein [Riemerella columbipharyngis]|uniref:Uncharacterized protein n=1 Tax=Riemerella columbipharyngis TaxID=1071918 RepID=A0A1G7A4J5_9FLAO|nr:hypothetical protein [Riemerella columbipharyngis]SDE09722.1 hypothetical protein SAMN05421544_10342 [Riemerella columbipharyngis]
MKKVILSVAVFSMVMGYAQKREIHRAFDAAQSGNIADVNTELAKADSEINNDLSLLEPSLLEEYYFAKGTALLKSNKTLEGADMLSKIIDLGKEKIYKGKNANRDRVYFVGKEAAGKSGLSGLSEDTYSPKTLDKVNALINPLLKATGDAAFTAYKNKDYAKAADKYLEVYNLLKATGNVDKVYKYYSALNYALANDKENAIKMYTDLINSGYTGVTTQYKAKDKDGQIVNLDKKSYDMLSKLGTSSGYSDFKTETTPSVEKELYETTTRLLVDAEKYDDALTIINKGLQKFPQNSILLDLQGTAYFKAGKTEQFLQSLQQKVAQDPSDKVSWYNLGVLYSKDDSKFGDAENAFKKALEVDPNYIPALQGIFYNVYMQGDDSKAINQAEAARKSKNMDLFNKILKERRERFAKGLPYLEKWYSLEPKNKEIVSLLKGVYLSLHKEDKFKEMKKVEESLEK